jgi:hypothetical protein
MDVITGTLTTGEWIVAIASGVLLLLSAIPFVWACWRFLQMSDGAVARAIEDAQRMADLKQQARLELSRPVVGRGR